jgi:two-component system LytT family response regulator
MKVLIVDDEPLVREHLRLLLETDRTIDHIEEAHNGREAVRRVASDRPDLVLLDVQMPGLNAFKVIEAIGAERMPPTIFVTAYDRYAVSAFEINAVDYLLKPISEERLKMALARAKDRMRTTLANDEARSFDAVIERIANPSRPLERIAVRTGERTSVVAIGDVDRIEAAQNYVRVCVGSASYLVHVTLNALEELLSPQMFLRIHRSHIVNVSRVKHLWTSTHGQYVIELADGQRLESSRSYGERIRSAFFNPF